MAKITEKTFKEALKNSGGNQTRIAEKLDKGRSAVANFLKKRPKMRELLDNEAEFVIDIAEDNLDTDIVLHKDTDASKWKLLNSKRGRARGYGQKTEVEHTGNTNITFEEVIKSSKEIKDGKKTNSS